MVALPKPDRQTHQPCELDPPKPRWVLKWCLCHYLSFFGVGWRGMKNILGSKQVVKMSMVQTKPPQLALSWPSTRGVVRLSEFLSHTHMALSQADHTTHKEILNSEFRLELRTAKIKMFYRGSTMDDAFFTQLVCQHCSVSLHKHLYVRHWQSQKKKILKRTKIWAFGFYLVFQSQKKHSLLAATYTYSYSMLQQAQTQSSCRSVTLTTSALTLAFLWTWAGT